MYILNPYSSYYHFCSSRSVQNVYDRSNLATIYGTQFLLLYCFSSTRSTFIDHTPTAQVAVTYIWRTLLVITGRPLCVLYRPAFGIAASNDYSRVPVAHAGC